MLTAKDAETDKITGLTLGADDYITKPFRPLEMIARVKSQLRRYQKYNPAHSDTGETSSAASEDNLVCGSLTMNIKAHTCFLGETPLVLTPTEFSILRILLENIGNVVSSEDLFHKIWQDEYYSKSNNTITVHEALASLFNKFYRVDQSRSSDTGGTGLGLAIAKEIVTLHGGAISASSKNHVVTFTVSLPLSN